MESELNSFLAGKNYTRLYNFNAFDIYDLNITERHIICVLISYCKQNPYNTITRSINSLISTCGNVYGRSTIFRVITKLKNIGLIFSEGNGIDSNVYSINVKKLKELQEYSPEQVSAAKKEYLDKIGKAKKILTQKTESVSNNIKPYRTDNQQGSPNGYTANCSNVSQENQANNTKSDIPFSYNPVIENELSQLSGAEDETLTYNEFNQTETFSGIENYFENASIPEECFNNVSIRDMPVSSFVSESFTPETVTSIPPAVSNVPAVQPPVQEEEKPKQKRFVKPTLQEITEVMAVKIREKYGSNVQDSLINDQAENFLNYYESNGWRVGKNPMKNWHCAVANWIKNIKTYSTAGTGTSGALIVATAEQSTRPDFDTIYKEVIDIAGKLQNRSNWLSESANKNIMAGVRTFIAEEIKAHWNLYGESDWKNALNVFIFAQKSPLRYLDPNFCKNNGFDSGLYNEFWTGSTFFIPRSSDEPTVTEQVIESEHFQKSLQEDLERKRRVSEFRKKLNAHREEMANANK